MVRVDQPDGLEWSIAKVTGSEEFAGDASAAVKQASASLQEATAFLPDYGFKQAAAPEGEAAAGEGEAAAWPAVDPGTSTAGVVGALITMAVALGIGLALNKRNQSGTPPSDSGTPA